MYLFCLAVISHPTRAKIGASPHFRTRLGAKSLLVKKVVHFALDIKIYHFGVSSVVFRFFARQQNQRAHWPEKIGSAKSAFLADFK